MGSAIAGIVIVALVLSGTAKAPDEASGAAAMAPVAAPAEVATESAREVAPESPGVGARVESDSYTDPTQVARCIAYNINRKMPQLLVRSIAPGSPGDSGYLALSLAEPAPKTFGVIRVERRESGSHLTTWLADRSLTAAPQDIARKLVAGC